MRFKKASIFREKFDAARQEEAKELMSWRSAKGLWFSELDLNLWQWQSSVVGLSLGNG